MKLLGAGPILIYVHPTGRLRVPQLMSPKVGITIRMAHAQYGMLDQVDALKRSLQNRKLGLFRIWTLPLKFCQGIWDPGLQYSPILSFACCNHWFCVPCLLLGVGVPNVLLWECWGWRWEEKVHGGLSEFLHFAIQLAYLLMFIDLHFPRVSILFSHLEPPCCLQLLGILPNLFPITGSRCLSLAHRAVARPRCYAKWRVCTTRSFSIAWSSWTPPVRSLGNWDAEAGYEDFEGGKDMWRGLIYHQSCLSWDLGMFDLCLSSFLVGRRMMNKLREFWNRDVTVRNGKISNKHRWYHRQQSEWQQQCRLLLS